MKQTVEEAARENILFNHRTVDRTLFGKDLAKFGEMNFVQGAEWQSKQSPWISVNERLPENEDMVFTLCKVKRSNNYFRQLYINLHQLYKNTALYLHLV